MLLSARSDTGNQAEQMDLPLPPSFKSLFREIILFLLSITLILKDPSKYTHSAEECRKAVEDELSQCETALLRTAREYKDHADKGDFMNESINTADTLFALLLQNAFALSCSGMGFEDRPPSPYCDLELIYRSWTSICHEKAVREASAGMYEDVRLLREELDTIATIYMEQKRVVDRTIQLRETPQAKLDIRLNKRIQSFLDDGIKHFSTLDAYAKEAETLVTNYIRVSNEDNSKAIYIFTTVTVIFLPLNAVSSALGMNVVDIRQTTRSSSLFWEIAVPTTVAVLVLCLILVRIKFKFRFKRRLGGMLLKVFPKGWEKEHMRVVKGLPRQG
jgi:Mg2+ and Co2+ transporter CorA